MSQARPRPSHYQRHKILKADLLKIGLCYRYGDRIVRLTHRLSVPALPARPSSSATGRPRPRPAETPVQARTRFLTFGGFLAVDECNGKVVRISNRCLAGLVVTARGSNPSDPTAPRNPISPTPSPSPSSNPISPSLPKIIRHRDLVVGNRYVLRFTYRGPQQLVRIACSHADRARASRAGTRPTPRFIVFDETRKVRPIAGTHIFFPESTPPYDPANSTAPVNSAAPVNSTNSTNSTVSANSADPNNITSVNSADPAKLARLPFAPARA